MGNEGLSDLEMADGRFVSIGLGTSSPKAARGTLGAEGRMAVPGFANKRHHGILASSTGVLKLA